MNQYLDFMGEEEGTVGHVHWGQIEEGTRDDETEKQAQKVAKNILDLNELIRIVCDHSGISSKTLTDKDLHRTSCIARKVVAQLGREYCGSNGKEVALVLGISEAAISQMLVKSQDGLEEIESLIASA